MQRSAIQVLTSAPLVVAATLGAVTVAHAQTITGVVRGVVKDDAGQVVKSAIVRLVPTSGGAPESTKTDSSGTYQFLGVIPGSYAVKVEVVTFEPQSQTITVTQDVTSDVDFTLSKSTTKSKQTVRVAPVRLGQASQQSTVTAAQEQMSKSQPNDLYQFPGLVFGQPGVSFDADGYVHIQGGDENEVGFSVDGVPIIRSIDNQFATNIVTVGLKSASVVEGGADASFGGGDGGFMNEITMNGRDLKAAGELGYIEYTDGPGNGWEYNGTNTAIGTTLGPKFDFYANTIVFQNKFPNNPQIASLNPSYDGLLKFNFYATANDTATLYLNQGTEKYFYPTPQGLPSYQTFNGNTGLTTADSGKFISDFAQQFYDLDYFNFEHTFGTGVVSAKIFHLFTRANVELDNSFDYYQYPGETDDGLNLDYTNQISHAYQLRVGYQLKDTDENYRLADPIPSLDQLANAPGTNAPATGVPSLPALPSGLFLDEAIKAKPTTNTLYETNKIRAFKDKLTLDLGVRYYNDNVKLALPGGAGNNLIDPDTGSPYVIPTGFSANDIYGSSHDMTATDPRASVAYNLTSTTVLRVSSSIYTQFPDMEDVQQVPSDLVGWAPTASDLGAQIQNFLDYFALYNPLEPERYHNENLGVEQGFNLSGLPSGTYDVDLETFRRNLSDGIQQDEPLYNYGPGATGPATYNNDGKRHISGLSLSISKKRTHQSDWTGQLSYMNMNAVGEDETFVGGGGYVPYWVQYAANAVGSQSFNGGQPLTDADYRKLIATDELPTSYDQHHTVQWVMSKRVSKLYETNFFVDAGSGFPIYDGAEPTLDPQHGGYDFDGAGYNEIPVVTTGNTLNPNNPLAGFTGWHYKFSLNNTFHVAPKTQLFLNIDNIFNKKDELGENTQAPGTGVPYYRPPTAAFPQGQIYYGPANFVNPRFISFGIRESF